MNDGYILIHRKIIDWQWYSNKNDRLLFIHCLISANWKDGWFNGEKIPRGSFATSLSNLSKECGLTMQQTRTSLNHLKSTNELTHHTNKQFSIITINNYDKYQTINTVDNKRLTNEQQTINNNRIKEIKEKKEINIKESISKDIQKKYFQSLKVNTLFNEFLELRKKLKAVNSERAINTLINKLSNYDEETQIKMIENSIVNSWKGIFEIKEKGKLPDWFNNEPQRKEIDYERKKLAEAINNGTYKP